MASKQMTQHEIEELLRTMGGGAVQSESSRGNENAVAATRRYQSYDFRRPSRFSKDHLRALQTIHERFNRTVASTLTSYLRLNVRLQLTSVEQAIFDDYVEQLPNPTVVYVLRLPPLEGPVVLELNMAPVLAILDRLCGGPGQLIEREHLTEVEQALLQPISRHLLRGLADAWSGVIRLNPVLEDTLLNPRVLRAIAPNEIVALLVMEYGVGDVSGTMSICLPHVTLEPIMSRLQSQAWLSEQSQSERETAEQQVRARLLEVPTDLTVELGEIELPASSVFTLQAGDVIRLGTPYTGDLTVRINGQPTFRCRPGVTSGNYAVQITSTVGSNGEVT